MDRVYKIVDLLLKSNCPVSVDFIAQNLNVSNKTIRNDFPKIQQIVDEANLTLTKKPGVGIIIEGLEERKLRLEEILKQDNRYIEPFSPEDRLNYILKQLFISKEPIAVKELSQSLYVSRVTVQKDLEKVEEWLSNFNLILQKKPNYGVEIIGNEEECRKAIANLLALTSNKGYEELKELLYDERERKIDYKSISKLKELVNIDYRLLEKIVAKAEKKLQFKFSDEAFVSLIMHIAISIKRLKEGKDVKLSEEMLNSLKENEEYEEARQIAEEIEESFKIKLPESEIGYILLHILGTKLLEGKSENLTIALEGQGDSELAVIMAREIISIAERALHMNLSKDKQLLNGLILHLRPTINRLKYDLALRNPMLKEIKENYIEIYGVAWMTSTVFEKYLSVKMPEEEIGYICLHLAASVERNKNPLKALIVCASGIGTSQFIAARLERSFRQIEIIDVISIIELKQRSLNGIDIVISTVPVEINRPKLMISPLLNQNDIRRLGIFIDNVYSNKTKNDETYSIIDKNLIRIRGSVESKELLIKEICGDLVNRKHIFEEYVYGVLEREKLYSTAIGGGVAIPHGEVALVKRSCFAISILDQPVCWGNESVEIIILLCISEKDREKSKKWMRNLYNFIEDSSNVKFLKNIKSSEEISRVMEEFIYAGK